VIYYYKRARAREASNSLAAAAPTLTWITQARRHALRHPTSDVMPLFPFAVSNPSLPTPFPPSHTHIRCISPRTTAPTHKDVRVRWQSSNSATEAAAASEGARQAQDQNNRRCTTHGGRREAHGRLARCHCSLSLPGDRSGGISASLFLFPTLGTCLHLNCKREVQACATFGYFLPQACRAHSAAGASPAASPPLF
jgi:hypothetical protein